MPEVIDTGEPSIITLCIGTIMYNYLRMTESSDKMIFIIATISV